MKNRWIQTASLGLQHVLAMYAGAVIVPLITGSALKMTSEQLTYLVSIDIFMCGIATFLQVWKGKWFGIGLPIVLGCTFTAVAPMIAIGQSYGLPGVYGAILASGIFVVLIAPVFSRLVQFFPPIVTGSVVTIIGLTLIPVAMKNMAGGEGSPDFGSPANIALSFGTLIVIIVLYRFFTGFIRSISVLLGLLAGTMAAAMMGKVDFSPVSEASWFHMIKPFVLGVPAFHWTSILTMIFVAIVSLVESTGVYFAAADICEKKVNEDDLKKGYRSEGIASILGSLFNSFPYTAFSQNIGLIQLSGVKSRSVIFVTAFILMLLGLIPKIGAFTTIIPSSVLGGAMVAMFGMVIAQGIKMLSKVDFTSQENLLIMACSIGMGLGVTVVPDLFGQLPKALQILTGNGIVAGSVTAIILNIVFHMIGKRTDKSTAVIQQKIS
ncbi:nucleobase:cation symporter-2 family protein [Bacillus smithii]|uniref:nucleobase:cation symporter-2 family protein n=1 Tax=Bacillus smithii TaxID=1479 RepID=UPI002E1ACC38|nr:nucleobase:cation symporter-2 family protein [Bacillus smithii]MED1455582.1 nucleobase:cation symporter-2 family protein [Bacillus smithii]